MRPYEYEPLEGRPRCSKCREPDALTYECMGICGIYGLHYHAVCSCGYAAVIRKYDFEYVCPRCGNEPEILRCNGPLGNPVLGVDCDPCSLGIRGAHLHVVCDKCGFEEAMQMGPDEKEWTDLIRRAIR